jgi:hypothetical protein
MRVRAGFAILSLVPALLAADKLTPADRIELMRGLTAEYATAKALIPHTRKTLEIDAKGSFDKDKWSEFAKESGSAARPGDLVQVTKIEIGSDRIVFQLNGGYSGGRKWYRNMQVGGGTSTNPVMVPVATDTNAPGGASVTLMFHQPLKPIKAGDVKKILAPILDFEKNSAAQVYTESLPPEVQQAVKENRVVEGMDRTQVTLAMGEPVYRSRETRDGVEYEDWVYGQAPGKITFVTFSGNKVVKVKEEYAGLGAISNDPLKPPEE